MQVTDGLDFFKKSFFSRQKTKTPSEGLRTIESITTIEGDAHCKAPSNFSLFLELEPNEKERSSPGEDPSEPRALPRPSEGVPQNCFKKVP